jgi:energy-converting hydrogenase Eha subunit A
MKNIVFFKLLICFIVLHLNVLTQKYKRASYEINHIFSHPIMKTVILRTQQRTKSNSFSDADLGAIYFTN